MGKVKNALRHVCTHREMALASPGVTPSKGSKPIFSTGIQDIRNIDYQYCIRFTQL